jgi:hypothetical protein
LNILRKKDRDDADNAELHDYEANLNKLDAKDKYWQEVLNEAHNQQNGNMRLKDRCGNIT